MMARIRTLKPEFWTDERIVSLTPVARLLFVGTWNFADDHGFIEASAVQLKLRVLPADACDVGALVAELFGADLLEEVEDADGRRWWHIRSWERHQRVSHPSPPRVVGFAVVTPSDAGLSQMLASAPESSGTFRPDRNGKERNGKEGRGVARGATTPSPDVDQVWAHYQALHPQARPTAKRRALAGDRLAEGYSALDLIEAIDGNHLDPHCNGRNDRGREYHAFELILRDAKHVDDYRGIHQRLADTPPGDQSLSIEDLLAMGGAEA